MASKQTVSICVEKLLDAMNQNHPSFKKGSDGRTYVGNGKIYNDKQS